VINPCKEIVANREESLHTGRPTACGPVGRPARIIPVPFRLLRPLG
jgi:hypothetical protein